MHDHRRPLSELAQEGEKALEDPCLHPVRPGERAVVLAVGAPNSGIRRPSSAVAGVRRLSRSSVAEPAAREDRRESPKRFDERGEWQAAAVTEADAATLEDEGTAVARPIGHLRDQPRLADPGVAADKDDEASPAAAPATASVRPASSASRPMKWARDACRHALHGR